MESVKLSHAYIVSGELAETLALSAVCSRKSGTGFAGSNSSVNDAGMDASSAGMDSSSAGMDSSGAGMGVSFTGMDAGGSDENGVSAGAGPCGVCKHCAKVLRGVHPDVISISVEKDKREVTVDQIRALKKDIIVIPNEAERKVYIINDADLMNRNAQNALLQALEEPPSHTVFILKTDNPTALLPTVRSRCMALHERQEADTALAAGANKRRSAAAAEMAGDFFSALESGNHALIVFMFKLEKLDKEAFARFLSAGRSQAASKLKDAAQGKTGLRREVIANAERVLLKAGEMLDLNVSTGHLSGMICASLMTDKKNS